MTPILATIYSMPFMLGAVAGLGLQRVYCRQKRRYLELRHPLPQGAKRSAEHISRVWLAALAAALSLGYVLFTAQVTHDQTIRLTKDVARCWQESYRSTKAQIDINAQNDGISRQQQALQREYDEDTSNWLKDMISPPGDLAAEATNSPARQVWGLQRTAQYQAQLDDLGGQFDDLVNQRTRLDVARQQHPLPETTCGK